MLAASAPAHGLAALVHTCNAACTTAKSLPDGLRKLFSSLPDRRVVVTGLGLVTPVGTTVPAAWANIVGGSTGVRALTENDLPQDHRKLLPQLTSQVVAAVCQQQFESSPFFPHDAPKHAARFTRFALAAAAEALADAGWSPETEEQRQATGVVLGNGMSATADIAEASKTLATAGVRKLSPFFVPRILVNMAAGAVSIKWGLQGPLHATSTACATGVHSIGDAYRMVQRGDADVMVAGASESCVDAVAIGGFCRLRALSTAFNATPAEASRPFDARRDGFVMGEGAGVVVLESLEHAVRRGARMYAEVRGYGLAGDAHHITQPHPEGRGAVLVMGRALRGSGVALEDVVYINAHATSTPLGDEIEQRAIQQVFGEAGVRGIAVSSTKGATGHLLGAAGAVETIFTILALHHRTAPPTANLHDPSPALLPNLVPLEAQPLRQGNTTTAALCNSFGFGGTNACLLLSTPPAV